MTAGATMASPPPPTATRPPWRLLTIVVYTLRSCIGPKRWLGCLLPCIGALLFGLITHALDEPAGEAFARVAADGIFGLVLPLAALVIGDAVFGAEIRSGVFHFTWLTPVPILQIIVGRWLGGCIVALVTIVPACALAAVIAGDPASAGAAAVAAFAGAVAYIAIFITIGCVTRRAAVWSLAFVFLVERLLGAALTGIAQWSPTWLSRAAFVDWVNDDPKSSLIREGIPAGTGAIIRLAVVTAIALGIARWRLAHLSLSGATD